VIATLQELLAQFRGQVINFDELKAQVQALCVLNPSGIDSVYDALQNAIDAGQLAQDRGQQLLSFLQAPPSAIAATLFRPTGEAQLQSARTIAHDTVSDAVTKIAGQATRSEVSAQIASDKTLVSGRIADVPENTSPDIGYEKTQLIPERRVASLDGEQAQATALNAAPPAFEPGALIKGRFLLKEQIGRGGMGIVFAAIDRRKTEARDPNPLVAIKILNTEFARHAKALIALQREARKAQELAHPNVATVFDFDREGDAVFMTMELLQGRSLDAVVREARGKGVSRETAMPIIRGIAEGLAYAHRKGIVHSDLKPANVFLTKDDAPKILDFGIARAIPSRVSAEVVKDIFDAGSLGAYTEAYATKEMMEGTDPHPADDVYALGLIAYELLAGTHPYKRYSAPEARQHGLKPAPIKGLRRREWKVIERSLSFERVQRPQDATAFLKQLSGVTRLQQGLIAATLMLALAAGYFAYSDYQEAGPVIPFSQLPVETQQQFTSLMADGDKLWTFYTKDKNVLALQEAVEQYAEAYQLHPRNRDATHALRKVADAALEATKSNPEQQREFAKALAERSDYLSKYQPIRAVLK
jgi:serine/threonine protein kinase